MLLNQPFNFGIMETFIDDSALFGNKEGMHSIPTNPTNPTAPFSDEPILESAGESSSSSTESQNHFFEGSPLISEEVYSNLPEILQSTCRRFEGRERDIILLGTITVLSASIPNIYGYYGERKIYPNLFLFVSAPASAGKGVLNHCRYMVMPIHELIKAKNEQAFKEYKEEYHKYKKESKSDHSIPAPKNPGKKMLFIPANNSASGALQLLEGNNGKGLIFETEGDTLSNTFRTEYGNYSDAFRKAFHHETISYYRKTEMEHVEIENPCLSAVLSGTPHQVLSLIPNTEDGLLSRFMFYVFSIDPKWKDVFQKKSGNGFDEEFLSIGKGYIDLYNKLSGNPEMEFHLNKEQNKHFNEYFAKLQDKFNSQWGSEMVSIARRLGLICFRISMILTVLRRNGKIHESLTCEDVDFKLAMEIIDVLQEHSRLAFLYVSKESAKGITLTDRFYNKLPQTFSRQEYLKTAQELGIKDKTAEKYIDRFQNDKILFKDTHNVYKKKA